MAMIRAIGGWRLALVGSVLAAGTLWSGGAWAEGLSGTTSSDVASVAVYVDTTYCATGGVQCTTTGHTAAPAASGNHNPVRIVVQVSVNNGSGFLVPVLGLGTSSFGVSTQFVPAGGANVEELVCASCFQEAGRGTYALFVHPIPGVTWKSGSYFVLIVFPIGGTTFFPTIARIDIP